MDDYPLDAKEILETKKIFAVIGVPQDEFKYGYELFTTLIEHNFTAYPINPKYEEIKGHKCYPDISALPEIPEVVIVALAPQNTQKTLDRVAKIKYAILWMPPGSWSDEVLNKCKQLGIKYVCDVCPVGVLKRLNKERSQK